MNKDEFDDVGMEGLVGCVGGGDESGGCGNDDASQVSPTLWIEDEFENVGMEGLGGGVGGGDEHGGEGCCANDNAGLGSPPLWVEDEFENVGIEGLGGGVGGGDESGGEGGGDGDGGNGGGDGEDGGDGLFIGPQQNPYIPMADEIRIFDDLQRIRFFFILRVIIHLTLPPKQGRPRGG